MTPRPLFPKFNFSRAMIAVISSMSVLDCWILSSYIAGDMFQTARVSSHTFEWGPD